MIIDLNTLKNKYDLSIKGVLHIGAHFGEENEIYEKLEIKNRIFFEPVKSNFNVLKKTVGDSYELHNFALGNQNGEILINIETANFGQSSSILKPKKHLELYPTITFDNTEVILIKKLDDVLFEREKFNFINIDVQGYELEVFKGGFETLKSIDYIYSEINRDEVYENCAKIDEIENFLSNFGFVLVENNWLGGIWGDGFFIKKNIL
jgi:FkbM family methyltransferase